jgi:hypothetical protein
MCSVVTISRFNRVTERNYKEWVYTTKKVVNNKNSIHAKSWMKTSTFTIGAVLVPTSWVATMSK